MKCNFFPTQLNVQFKAINNLKSSGIKFGIVAHFHCCWNQVRKGFFKRINIQNIKTKKPDPVRIQRLPYMTWARTRSICYKYTARPTCKDDLGLISENSYSVATSHFHLSLWLAASNIYVYCRYIYYIIASKKKWSGKPLLMSCCCLHKETLSLIAVYRIGALSLLIEKW
jgi:hypothetical protein